MKREKWETNKMAMYLSPPTKTKCHWCRVLGFEQDLWIGLILNFKSQLQTQHQLNQPIG
jgi:hypothetical protein